MKFYLYYIEEDTEEYNQGEMYVATNKVEDGFSVGSRQVLTSKQELRQFLAERYFEKIEPTEIENIENTPDPEKYKKLLSMFNNLEIERGSVKERTV